MKIFGRAKKSETARRRNIESAEITFQNYRRGTTLASAGDDQREKSERQKEKLSRVRRRKLGAVLLAVIIILVFCGMLLLEYGGSIDKVADNPSKSAEYLATIGEYLNENPLERFGFLRNTERMEKYMIEHAPEIKSFRIEKTGLMDSELIIEFRKPLVAWHIGGVTSYVDETGAVFVENYLAEPEIRIIEKNVLDGDKPTASVAFLKFVGQVVVEMSGQDEIIDRVEIPTGAIRYVEIYLVNREYPFKAQIDRDPSSQASDIIAMARYIDDHNITPEYVDCRVVNKAYWK